MSYRFASFQMLLNDKFFNYYLERTKEEEETDSRILTLGWVTSHFERLNVFHNTFYPMFTDGCQLKSVSGGTRVKLLTEYCDFTLSVRECLKVFQEGVCYAQRWATLVDSVVSAFKPELVELVAVGVPGPATLVDSVVSAFKPESVELVAVGVPGPMFSFSNFRAGILSLSLLKEELFQERGIYERAFTRFVGTFGMDLYESPVDTDNSSYFDWCNGSSEFLSQKCRLMANQLRIGPLTGNLNLLIYSMNFLMFWCTVVASLAFVPRANGPFPGMDFSVRRVSSVGPKVTWKDSSDSLLEKMLKVLPMDSRRFRISALKDASDSLSDDLNFGSDASVFLLEMMLKVLPIGSKCLRISAREDASDSLPDDLKFGSLKQLGRIAGVTNVLCDLLGGVEYQLLTLDQIAEINYNVDELSWITSSFNDNLKAFEVKLEEIIVELENGWANAMDVLEKYS